MLGISLLVIAILTYVLDLKKISLFIFTTFMLNGWCVLTDDVLGVKNFDMAVIYTLVVLDSWCSTSSSRTTTTSSPPTKLCRDVVLHFYSCHISFYEKLK